MKNFLRLACLLLASLISVAHAQQATNIASQSPTPHPASDTAAGHHPPHWAYQGKEGPNHWGELDQAYSACKLGHEQSPIDIQDAQKAKLDPIQFDYKPAELKIINNGHSIQVNYAPGSSITVGGHRYELKQFHFHHPSEEKINGKSYQLVIHLVHADAEGKLGVVAVLLDPGPAQATIQSIWDHLPQQKNVETDAGITINAADLLPTDHGYYNFMGSLTTPPCSEQVTWFVLKTPATVSPAEVETFSAIYPMNARPIQPIGSRVIKVSE
jgi:carbonic anhydrase